MNFSFNKAYCQTLENSLRSEWLETNGLGDYSSSTTVCCNTRKYHGLLVSGGGYPEKRAVILSSFDESIFARNEYSFSCARYPGTFHPQGYQYLESMNIAHWPVFRYIFPDGLKLKKELMMVQNTCILLIRYEANEPAILKLKPLTAFRHFHTLRRTGERFNTETECVPDGIMLDPCYEMPPLYIYTDSRHMFNTDPCWYYNVEYSAEQERGFDFHEDLFCPGTFEISMEPGKPIYVAASTNAQAELTPGAAIAGKWEKESRRRKRTAPTAKTTEGHLAAEGKRFITKQANGFTGILAGYHWFNIWGRDMLIALPWLTFHADRAKTGADILRGIGASVKNGLVPNMFAADGNAYNSVDASLWYIWAVQEMYKHSPKHNAVVKKELWPIIKYILSAYSGGKVPFVNIDNKCFLHVGTENTQLTWMDASVNGIPATPRYGCPVEINALWYNAISFAGELATKYGEEWNGYDTENMRKEFTDRFWLADKGYMADVWRPEWTDTSLRPNQLFAMSLPYPLLEDRYHKQAVMQVKQHLLTPYGLRTLAPGSHGYRARYEGAPQDRDAAYHQGTVWPWLLGAYTQALLKATNNSSKEVKELLKTLTPLFTTHLYNAGIGSISEIFDAEPPYRPNGTIAQAWSISECYRVLCLAKNSAPEAYKEWEKETQTGGL